MKISAMLEAVRSEVEAVEPRVGRVYHTLLSKFEPGEIALDTRFLDPRLGPDQVVKFFIVFPNDGELKRHTTGRPGYLLLDQEFVISGFVNVQKSGGPELVLVDDFENISRRLSSLLRVVDSAGQETEVSNPGPFRISGIDRIKVGDTLCHFMTMRFSLAERRLGGV